MFDLSKPGAQITNKEIEQQMHSVGRNSPELWTLTRIHAHMHQFGHVAGTPHDEFGQQTDYALSKADLERIAQRR